MTNATDDRLDRIERILETVAQRQEAISQQQEINTRSIELLGQRVDSNAKAIEANSAAIAANHEANNTAIAATRALVNGLVQTITEFSVRTEARLNRLDDVVAAISATNQRLERILNRLTQHNGDDDQPQ